MEVFCFLKLLDFFHLGPVLGLMLVVADGGWWWLLAAVMRPALGLMCLELFGLLYGWLLVGGFF